MNLPLSLLVTHFIGDFLLQSDWMALNKSKQWTPLYVHCFIYSMCFAWVGGGTSFVFVLWTFLAHFITDAITSRITSTLWFFKVDNSHYIDQDCYIPIPTKRHWFFVMIGLDQLIHFGTLAWTYKLLVGA